MADRGFNIQDLLEEKGVRVNIPPFLKGKEQLSGNELVETRRIANTRIHKIIIFWTSFLLLCVRTS